MEIIVCIKAVCMNPIRFSLSDDGDQIDCGNRTLVTNEIDEYALEQALVMKEQLGGKVTVISAGGLPVQDVLYKAKAMGADRTIRISAELSNPSETAEALAQTVRNIPFDLVLTGSESSDGMNGQTGIYLASKLGLPCAYAVTAVDMETTSGFITINKELGSGIFQVMEIKLPALLCIQSGIQKLRYTPPAKIIQARKEPLEVIDVEIESLNSAQTMRPKFTKLFKPESSRNAEYMEGNPSEIATKIVRKILEVG